MRLRVAISSLSCLFIFQLPAWGQQSAPTPAATVARDPQAITVMQQSIAALGGPAAVAQLQSVVVQGSITAVLGSNDPSGNFILEDLFGAQLHEFRDSFQSSALTQSFVSGHGTPGVSSNGRTRKFATHMANFRLATHIPVFALAQALANPNCNIELVGPINLNGQPAIQVHLHIDTDILQQTLSVQDWYFDVSTGLPLRVEYRLPDASNGLYFINAASDFSAFRPVQGILFPFQILSYRGGTPRSVLAVSSVTVNQAIATSDFDLPSAVAQ